MTDIDDVYEKFMENAIEDFKEGDSLAVEAVNLLRAMTKRKDDFVVWFLAGLMEGWCMEYRKEHPDDEDWGLEDQPDEDSN